MKIREQDMEELRKIRRTSMRYDERKPYTVAASGGYIRTCEALVRRGLLVPAGSGAIDECEVRGCRFGCRENHPYYELTAAAMEAVEADAKSAAEKACAR